MGAGPAGAAAALGALYADPRLRVLLLDRADFPRDKSLRRRDRAARLRRARPVGVERRRRTAGPRCAAWSSPAASRRVARPMARPVWVIPREVFDARLVERAVAAGAVLRPAPGRARSGSRDERVVLDERFRARVVVGADGAHSRRPAAARRCRRAPRAGDPRLRADADRPPGPPGDPLRRPPPAVVRLGLRPRRRPVQRRVRRAAARRPHRRPAEPARCCSTSSSGCCPAASRRATSWRAHHLPLSGWRWRPAGRAGAAGR